MQLWDQHRYIKIKFLIFLKLYIFLARVNIKYVKKGKIKVLTELPTELPLFS